MTAEFDAWRDEALRVADSLDPMKNPVAATLGSTNREPTDSPS